MSLSPRNLKQYHVFLASPGDVNAERQHVRKFFERYNRQTAQLWNVRFEVIDWENYSTTGVGRPQELITAQTLEKYRDSLALVVGIMGQRFGSPSGKAESGTEDEEEFNWAMESYKESGFPEIKWFFRKVEALAIPPDPKQARKALKQWEKVLAFRQRMQDFNDPVFYTEYPGSDEFADVFDQDLSLWLADSARPWVSEHNKNSTSTSDAADNTNQFGLLPPDFDLETYRKALIERFDNLNFEMLDVTGAYYGGVRLWSVFVPQSVRESHEYYPQLLEIPKEHQKRLLDIGELDESDLAEAMEKADVRRQEYFSQPLRQAIEVADDKPIKRMMILGDPGSGKSSLLRYLALRWARIEETNQQSHMQLPLLIELREYNRWQCTSGKDFVRYLHEASTWHRLVLKWTPSQDQFSINLRRNSLSSYKP